MTKAERTKQFIIEETSTLFNTRGYDGTSIKDVTDTTGLTKGSIYGNFESKDALAAAVYDYNFQRLMKAVNGVMQEKSTAFDKLMAFTGYYRANLKKLFEC